VKNIVSNFIKLLFLFILFFSCEKKNSVQEKMNVKVVLNVPIEVDFFINTATKILKIQNNQGKNENYMIKINTCNKMVSIEKKENNFIVSLFNNTVKQKCRIGFFSNNYEKNIYINTIFISIKIKNNFYADETSILPISNLGISYLNFKVQYGSLLQENQYYYQTLHQENLQKNLEIIYSREFAKEKSVFSFSFINNLVSPIEDSEWWLKKYKTYKKLMQSNTYFSFVGICYAAICENRGGFYLSQGLIYYDKNLKSYFAQEILFSEL
jgi:hypothetical protein